MVTRRLVVDAELTRAIGTAERVAALAMTQIMYSAPWEIPRDALDSDAVQIGLQEIAARKPR